MPTRLIIFLLIVSPLFTAFPQTAPANLYPMQEGFVDSHGVLIYYKSVGHGEPLMIVHGGPGASHDYFLPYLLPLMPTSRLIFIDERGSGRSSKLEDTKQYTIGNMVEDIETVRVALNLGKVSLLGHSYGGALTQAYALKYQQNLTHLILGSTFASTKELNAALAKMKSEMDPKDIERVGRPLAGDRASAARHVHRRTPMFDGPAHLHIPA